MKFFDQYDQNLDQHFGMKTNLVENFLSNSVIF